jgi:hypothetical protein
MLPIPPPSAADSGRLTQRLECYPHTVEVAGSNPAPPIDVIPKLITSARVAVMTC